MGIAQASLSKDTWGPQPGTDPPSSLPCSVPFLCIIAEQLEQNFLLSRNLVMPLASGKRFFDGVFMGFLFPVNALFVGTSE